MTEALIQYCVDILDKFNTYITVWITLAQKVKPPHCIGSNYLLNSLIYWTQYINV